MDAIPALRDGFFYLPGCLWQAAKRIGMTGASYGLVDAIRRAKKIAGHRPA